MALPTRTERKETPAENFFSLIKMLDVRLSPQNAANSILKMPFLYVLGHNYFCALNISDKKFTGTIDCKDVLKLIDLPDNCLASFSKSELKKEDKGRIQIWRTLGDGRLECEANFSLDGTPIKPSSLVASSDGRYFAAINKNKRYISVWRYDSLKQRTKEFEVQPSHLFNHDPYLTNLANIQIIFTSSQQFAVVADYIPAHHVGNFTKHNNIELFDIEDLESSFSCKSVFRKTIGQLSEFHPSPDGKLGVCVLIKYDVERNYQKTILRFFDLNKRELRDDIPDLNLNQDHRLHSIQWINNTVHFIYSNTKDLTCYHVTFDPYSKSYKCKEMKNISRDNPLRSWVAVNSESCFVSQKDGSCYLDTQPLNAVDHALQHYDDPSKMLMMIMRNSRGAETLFPSLQNIICNYLRGDRHLFFSQSCIPKFSLDDIHDLIYKYIHSLQAILEKKSSKSEPSEEKAIFKNPVGQVSDDLFALTYYLSGTDKNQSIHERIEDTLNCCEEGNKKLSAYILGIFKQLLVNLGHEKQPEIKKDKDKEKPSSMSRRS